MPPAQLPHPKIAAGNRGLPSPFLTAVLPTWEECGGTACIGVQGAGRVLSRRMHSQHPFLPATEHRLRFQVPLEDVEVAEREDAVLECQVPLGSIPTSWFLEDRELQPSQKYVMEECGVVRRLTIRDARTDDDGVYLCQMKDRGRSVAEVSVRGGSGPSSAFQ